jgi:cobalamin synthase
MRKNNAAQPILEYVVAVIIVVAVFLAMGVYYKRSLQGKYRQAGDILGAGSQFTPP